MNRDEIIEQAAQLLSTFTTCDGRPWTTELHRRQARALADAGLIARPLPDREEIAESLHGDQCPEDPEPDEYCMCDATYYDRLADAVLALMKGQDR